MGGAGFFGEGPNRLLKLKGEELHVRQTFTYKQKTLRKFS